ncbi:MAG: AMP-binding protein [Deltaproteobacteria bacterium]|nr:AMP-binding protein [Deltaproteobacteria bacterium]MBW2070464.1 AMP-binding protein [Deltaproteobacteria bacterium]
MTRPERAVSFYDEHLETMPWEEKEQLLQQQLQKMVRFAYERSEAMRQKFLAAGIEPTEVQNIEDLQKLAITSKAKMRQLQQATPPFGGFLAVDPGELRRIYTSPGPIFDPEGRQPDYWRLQSCFYNCGFRAGDRVMNTFSYHLTPGGLMCDEALTGIGCTVIPGGVGNTETQLQLLQELRINGYIGVPSFLQTLIERAEQSGKDFRREFHLQTAVTAGEMLSSSARTTLQHHYGITVRQFYATADVGAIAYECQAQNGMHFAEHRLIEVVDPDTGAQLGPGEVGEVVVTLLDNEVYPLIRFGTGDLSYYEDTPCDCGRSSPRLMKLVGRVDQLTKVRGMFIHPSQIDELTAAFPEINLAQAVVNRSANQDTLTLQVVLRQEPSSREDFAGKLQDRARSVLKLRADVAFVQEDEISEPEKRIIDLRKWD